MGAARWLLGASRCGQTRLLTCINVSPVYLVRPYPWNWMFMGVLFSPGLMGGMGAAGESLGEGLSSLGEGFGDLGEGLGDMIGGFFDF